MVAEKVFAVIAENTRRDILEALAQENKAVGQLVDELGVSQPTVSKHLRVLREAGVVTMRAQGQKRYYGINTEPLALVSTWLESLGAGPAPATVPVSSALESNVADAVSAPAAASVPAVSAPTASLVSVTERGGITGVESKVAPSQQLDLVQSNEFDVSVQGQISRSVGRAANRAAGVLASLPKLRRKKDS